MNIRWLGFVCVTVTLLLPMNSRGTAATIVIPTNQNGGADAEVREEEINPNGSGVPQGTNRGSNTELATRAKDSTANGGDRSTAIYLKFDISGLTQSDLDTNDGTTLRLTVRNAASLRWNRVYGRNPYYGSLPADDTNPEFVFFINNPANYTRAAFNVYGLTSFSNPNHNWSESAITWYNAPGITPDSATTPLQDPGKYNFNSHLTLLGQFSLPDPPPPAPPATGSGSPYLYVGQAVDYVDTPDGSLHNLIQNAKNAGEAYVTLVVAFNALNSHQNSTGETIQTTPNDFINFNYLFNPKEQDANTSLAGLQLQPDPSYDPDGPNGPLPAGPGAFSGANNDNGQFSPQLRLYRLGDLDGDGVVDRTDAALCAKHFGMVTGATADDCDFDGDRDVDLADWRTLQSRLGAPSPSSAVSAHVPEPSTMGLTFLGALILLSVWRGGTIWQAGGPQRSCLRFADDFADPQGTDLWRECADRLSPNP
jgi:hypothetical protein